MAMLPVAAIVLLIAVTLTFVLLPLWRPLHQPAGLLYWPDGTISALQVSQLSERVELIARRDALYAAIKEAEFDHDMGKMDEADYQTLRNCAVQEAAQVLRRLDRLTPEAEATPDRDIEQAVARVHTAAAGPARTGLPQAIVESVEAEIAALVRHSGCLQDPGEMACPNCGQISRPGDAFCAHCGTPLREPVAPPRSSH
jgi:hypothetical protein